MKGAVIVARRVFIRTLAKAGTSRATLITLARAFDIFNCFASHRLSSIVIEYR